MSAYFDVLADFAGSLAIVATLAWWYGSLNRRIGGGRVGPIFVGVLFGLVAAVQMHMPLEPYPGLIIDMRVVPVALAGAFLGSGGLLVCVGIAMVTRYQIGGVGMEAGLAVIIMAGLAGLLWSAMTSGLRRRRLAHFIGLAMLASTSVVAGLLLPPYLAAWFMTTAAPAVVLTYLLVIPVIAMIMERARLRLVEDKSVAAPEIDPASGLSTKQAFARRIASISASSTSPRVTTVLVIGMRQRRFLSSYWEQDMVDHVLSGLRLRIEGLVHYGADLGRTRDGDILVGLTAEEAGDIDAIGTNIQRAVADKKIALPGGEVARVTVSDRLVELSDPASSAAVMTDLSPRAVSPRPFQGKRRHARGPVDMSLLPFRSSHEGLFSYLDERMPKAKRRGRKRTGTG